LNRSKYQKIGKELGGDLTLEFLKDLYHKQNGRCNYFNIPLRFAKKSDWKASLERINPKKGYFQDNVVLICWEFNMSKSACWSKDKWDYFVENNKYAVN